MYIYDRHVCVCIMQCVHVYWCVFVAAGDACMHPCSVCMYRYAYIYVHVCCIYRCMHAYVYMYMCRPNGCTYIYNYTYECVCMNVQYICI